MKYTVILDQPLPPDLRTLIVEQLVRSFGLAPDQAEKLAARRAGRLLKPTGQARANALLELYQGVGAQVRLDAVDDDAAGAAPVAALAAATSANAGAMSGASAPASDSPFSDNPFSDFSAFAAPAAAPAMTSSDSAWSDFTGSLGLPTSESRAPSSGLGGGFLGDGMPGIPTELAGGVPALAEGEPVQAGVITPTFTQVPETAASSGLRRIKLGQRITLTSLLPLLLTTLATLAFLLIYLPRQQTELIRQGAQAVATTIGSSVDISDEDAVFTQLGALVRQQSVGFVRVDTADLPFFLSKFDDRSVNRVLGARVLNWLTTNPDGNSFTFVSQPGDEEREQLKAMLDRGAKDSLPAVQELKQKIQNIKGAAVTTHYEVVRVGVYTLNGLRSVGPAEPAAGQPKPRYTVAVGVISDPSRRVVNQTLLLILLVSLLAVGIASYFAATTARRVVQPIERLVKAADAISLGQLDTPVTAERNDEIGDLAQALERMRLSLEAAMARLRRRRGR